jgi:hypothetical protein
MANLRSLLGTESATLAGIYSGGVGRLKPGQTYYFNINNECVTCNTIDYTRCNDGNTTDARGCPVTGGGFETFAWNATVLCCWKPPYGATRLDFELWGAGGGGATACCCAIGIPAGAGAYSRMTVRSGLGSVTAGIGSDWTYTLVLGPRTCNGGTTIGSASSATQPRPYSHGACQSGDIPGVTLNRGPVQGTGGMTGYAGSDTWAIGCGLENFCAQGGVPGCAFCWLGYGHFITGFNSMTIGAAKSFTNAGLSTSCCACCAMYYGCSGSGAGLNSATGAPGLPGAVWHVCGQCRHWDGIFVPYPGGLVNQKGGHMIYHMCGSSCCFCSVQRYLMDSLGFAAGGNENGSYNYPPGIGGMSAWVNGGSCCCGATGYPGAARITVYYD